MSVSLEALGVKSLPDANPRYCPIGNTTLLLSNTAEQVDYIAEAVQSKSANSLTFSLDLSDRFIGRDMYLRWTDIPLEVTRSAATTVISTPINYHKNFFDDYKSLAMKQYGLLNAINTLSITVDGKTISTVRGSDLMEMISHYYSKEEVHRHFQASNPNLYYSNLVKDTSPWIPSISLSNENLIVKGSSISENDPFSPAAGDGYNSRTPLFTPTNGDVDIAAGQTSMKVRLQNQMTWLPFNILGINGDTSPLYGANKMNISIELHSGWENRIFSTKRIARAGSDTSTTSPFKFKLDRANWGSNSSGEVFLHYKKFLAPQYISSQLNPRTDKWIQDYTIVQMDQRTQDVAFTATEKNKAIASTPFVLNAIPKKLYVALVNKRVTDEDYLTDAVHFCRWNTMTVDLMGAKTTIGNGSSGAMELYMVSKANGLEMTENQALYTLGFPVCLDVSNDLGCRTNSFVGLSTADASGQVVVRISGDVTRLHYDTEAANFDVSVTTKDDLFKRLEKSYEFRLIIVYAGFFACNMNGAKFSTIESLTVDGLASMSSHVQNLMESFAPRMNTLGGSWISSLLPSLKNVGQGVLNVIKAAVNNKSGFRDSLTNAYKGGGFDNHAPVLGGAFGQTQGNFVGGRAINGWDSQ